MRRLNIISTFIVAALAVTSARAAGPKPTVKSIGAGVICQCGCNFPVSTCNHEQCSSRDEMKALAEKEIAACKNETTILQDFVLRYGVKVLATPPASGFNRWVWIMTFESGLLIAPHSSLVVPHSQSTNVSCYRFNQFDRAGRVRGCSAARSAGRGGAPGADRRDAARRLEAPSVGGLRKHSGPGVRVQSRKDCRRRLPVAAGKLPSGGGGADARLAGGGASGEHSRCFHRAR